MKKIILAAICFFVLSTALLLTVDKEAIDTAHAESTNIEELCRQYTSTSSPNGINIDNYINDFKSKSENEYGMISQIDFGTYFQNACVYDSSTAIKVKAYGDDNITKIIPRELFTYVNEYLYIGEEYGFYINTKKMDSVSEEYLLKSTVIIIDVITSQSNDNDYEVEVKIQPLIQLDYYYIKRDFYILSFLFKLVSNESFYPLDFNAILQNNISNAVIPAISYNSNPQYKQFAESSDYSISDISFAANVYNVNAPNQSDSNYDIDEDYGYFFIGNDYYYSATRKYNDTEQYGVKQIASSLLSAGLGKIPVFGDIISATGTFLDVMEGISIATSDITYNESNEKYGYSGTNFPNTRETQKASYTYLLKTSKMIINSTDSDRLLFESDDYAKGVFVVSHTDKSDGTKEYNRIKVEVALKVIDNNLNSNNVSCFTGNSLEFDINSPVTGTANFLSEDNNFYIFPHGMQKFKFIPDYSGTYTFDLNPNSDLGVKIGTDFVNIDNGSFARDLSAGVAFEFEVYNNGNALKEGNVFIDVASISGNNKLFDINNNDQYILKYIPAASSMYDITGSENLLISDICCLDINGNLQRINMYSETEYVPADQAQFFLTVNTDYYFISQKIQNATGECSISFSMLEDILQNENEIEIHSNCNYVFYKYTYSGSSDHNIRMLFDNITNINDVFKGIVYNANGDKLATQSHSYGEIIINNINVNSVYYIGIKLISADTFTLQTKPLIIDYEAEYQWRIWQGDEEITDDFANSIELPRNATYKFEFWIEDYVKVQKIALTISESGAQDLIINNVTGVVTIKPTRRDGESFTLCGMADDETFYSYTLQVIPRFNTNEITFDTIDYENAMRVKIETVASRAEPAGSITESIIKLYCTLSGHNANNVAFSEQYVLNSLEIDLLVDLVNYGAIGDATFIINSVEVDTASLNNSIRNLNKAITLNCMYSRYEAKKPIFITYHYYYIANALQLYNIRYDMSYTRHIENDIDLSVYTSGNRNWTPIPSLDCNLYGGRNKITNLKYYIGTGTQTVSDIGLVGVNNSMIINVIIDAINISSAEGQHSLPWVNVGGIAGVNNGMIVDCKVTGSIIVHRSCSNTGGIVGKNTSNGISGCDFGDQSAARSVIDTNGDAGGIAGYNSGLVIGCNTVNADIKNYAIQDSRSTGGIVGYCPGGTIKDCTVNNVNVLNRNPSTIDHLYPKMGLIVGHLDNGILQSVGSTDSYGYCGGLTPTTSIYCFNGDWPFYGKIDNSQIDNTVNVNGP